MATVSFNFNGIETKVQCEKTAIMKNIIKNFGNKAQIDNVDNLCFIYGGNKLNSDLTFEQIATNVDKESNEMSVLVFQNEEEATKIEGLKESKNIICQKCKENCILGFKNYKIRLSDCKNGHDIKNISLDEFKNTQMINENNIKCGKCNKTKFKSYNGIFYRCLTCKENTCPLCKKSHTDQNHKVIDYDNVNYVCEIHNDFYYSYCYECKNNLCLSCKQKHDRNHKMINFENILPDDVEIKNELSNFKSKIDIIKKHIDEIKEMLDKVKEYMDAYYKINFDLINSYDNQKKNYYVLKSINSIKDNIKLEDIDNIINEKSLDKKLGSILNIYNKMSNKNNERFILRYNIDKHYIQNNKIKIFGEKFVKNNENNCKILCKGQSYKLVDYFDISNCDKENNMLEIEIEGINNITNASYMFYECNCLSPLSQISEWDTSKITDMEALFSNCASCTSLPDITQWDTSNVTNISCMFENCSSLSTIPDISDWNVNNVTNMNHIFCGCWSLKSLPDISKWNIEKVKDINSLFSTCYSLSSLPEISKWNTKNVSNMFQIFGRCTSLKSLPDISKWNTSNVTDMSKLFIGCESLLSLPNISDWNTSHVNKMFLMFANCLSLTTLPDISKWDINNVSSKKDMFKGCKDTLKFPEKFRQ